MKLLDIELHDMPLKELLLFFESQEIAIVFYTYLDEEEKYITHTLSFKKVKNLTIDSPFITETNRMGIFSLTEISHKKLNFSFTGGFSSPNTELLFEYELAFLDNIQLD